MTPYYRCAECELPIVGDDVDVRHSRDDGEDVHDYCCPVCDRPIDATPRSVESSTTALPTTTRETP